VASIGVSIFQEHLVSITKKGKQGLAEINAIMVRLRENPWTALNGQKVIRIEDYKASLAKNPITGETQILSFPKADVLIFITADGSKICARPSGTEPKIKFYISVHSALNRIDNYTKVSHILIDKINTLLIRIESEFNLVP